jgi:hypothetical protein
MTSDFNRRIPDSRGRRARFERQYWLLQAPAPALTFHAWRRRHHDPHALKAGIIGEGALGRRRGAVLLIGLARSGLSRLANLMR